MRDTKAPESTEAFSLLVLLPTFFFYVWRRKGTKEVPY